VLVIDDEPDIRQLVALLLRMEGLHVLEAESGDEGLQRLTDHAVDLVVLDIIMPEMDGWEVCRRLRADPTTAPIPVVILSVCSEFEHRPRNLTDVYLSKPFHRQELLATVRRLLHTPDPALPLPTMQ
jgi:CheY-like chemotaxis protein